MRVRIGECVRSERCAEALQTGQHETICRHMAISHDGDRVVRFGPDGRVTITSYRTDEALAVHRRHDIAVVPSLCGEATCLAVLEAMAAGCVVAATNMGGMTTEIIDGLNGVLCWPAADSLLAGLLRLIDDADGRGRMQRLGWETSQRSFSLAAWQGRWRYVWHRVIAQEFGPRRT